jgi:uncharacterized membrane protein
MPDEATTPEGGTPEEQKPEDKPQAEAAAGEVSKDEKTMSMISWLLSGLTPIVPLIIYLVKKDEGKFIRYHALQSLYFSLVSLGVIMVSCGFLFPVTAIIGVLWGLKANKGEWAAMPVIGGWVKRE